MDMNIDIKPALEVRARLEVLHDVVHELADGFGADYSQLETIRKGVLDQQLLKDIIFYYMDKENLIVAEITISIDWSRHRVLAQSSDGKTFTVNPRTSISKQLSDLYPTLIDHMKKLRAALGVTTTKVQYRYQNDVYNDKQKLTAARTFLGTSASDDAQKWREQTRDPKLPVEIEVITKKLSELMIHIRHRK